MTIDTAALRARPVHYNRANDPGVVIVYDYERDALCDGYDEAESLRVALSEAQEAAADAVDEWDAAVTNRDAARQALADLVADLRALLGTWATGDDNRADNVQADLRLNAVRTVIDRHAPEGAA